MTATATYKNMMTTEEWLTQILKEWQDAAGEIGPETSGSDAEHIDDVIARAQKSLQAVRDGHTVEIKEIRRPCGLSASGSVIDDYEFRTVKNA